MIKKNTCETENVKTRICRFNHGMANTLGIITLVFVMLRDK